MEGGSDSGAGSARKEAADAIATAPHDALPAAVVTTPVAAVTQDEEKKEEMSMSERFSNGLFYMDSLDKTELMLLGPLTAAHKAETILQHSYDACG